MAPPALGSEVNVIRTGKITRYNNHDNTANVKFNAGRGRPNKVPFTHFVTPPDIESVMLTPVPEVEAILEPSCPVVVQKALPAPRKKRSFLSWASFVTVIGAIGVGLFHGLGSKVFELGWDKIAPLLHLPV